MKKLLYTLLGGVMFLNVGCNKDKDFLTTPSYGILTDKQVFETKDLAFSALADLYTGYVDQQTITNWAEFTNFDEAFPSEAGQYGKVQQREYPYDWFRLWNYDYIRNINYYIQNLSNSTQILAADKNQLLAEAKFLRAANYFEMAKRMGGVPLITVPLTYDYTGDPSYLQYARAKESEVYDFVISQLDSAKAFLPDDARTQDRATKGACLAMKARAALYAASIAKYGVNTPTVTLPGGEVGIPVSMAPAYYQKCVDACTELINSGKYSLYTKNGNTSENFAALFYDKGNNPEVIFAQNFKLKSAIEWWTVGNQPKAISEDGYAGGRINPSLNLVMQFEKLDNTYAALKVSDITTNNCTYFDNESDIFNGRDVRLAGTVMLPGTQFKQKDIDILAGFIVPDSSFKVYNSQDFGGQAQLPGQATTQKVVGFSGPTSGGKEFGAQTGFYVRKFMDPVVGSGQSGTQSEVWWVRYRYAEVLLNMAEAQFELGNTTAAATYINQVRKRAGFTTDLTASQITFDRIVHERRVELAFEGHEPFDYKRWRIADKVWNGNPIVYTDLVNGMGKATAPSTQIWGIWPYKVYAQPGSPNYANNGKWMYIATKPNAVTASRYFQLGNYYSSIDAGWIANNPKLVKNPNQ